MFKHVPRSRVQHSLFLLAICACAAAGIPCALAYGETLVVDAGSGGQFPSLKNALKKAKDGDVIEVRPGRYELGVTVNKNVEIVGAGPNETIFEARKDCFKVSKVTTGKISGIAFLTPSFPAGGCVKLEKCGKDFLFTKNLIQAGQGMSEESVVKEARPALVVEGGEPRITENAIWGGILVKGKGTNPQVDNDLTPFAQAREAQNQFLALVALSGEIGGKLTFESADIRNVDISGELEDALTVRLCRFFPSSLILLKQASAQVANCFSLSANVIELTGNYTGGVETSAQVELSLAKDRQPVCTASGSGNGTATSVPTTTEDGVTYVDYGGVFRALYPNVGPFGKAIRAAVDDALANLQGQSAQMQAGLEEEQTWTKAVELAQKGNGTGLEEYGKRYPDGKHRQDVQSQLVNIKIDAALKAGDTDTLSKILAENPNHPREREITTYLNQAKNKKEK